MKDPLKCDKGQKFKDHITVIFACSAMMEKLKLTAIGHSKSLYSFGVLKASIQSATITARRHGKYASSLKPTSAGEEQSWSWTSLILQH